MNLRMVFFDLDDTLLSPDHATVAPRTEKALYRLQEAGVLLAIATGRSRAFIPESLSSLPFRYLLTSNGADVVDVQSETHVHTDYISPEDAAVAWKILEPHGLFVEWYVENEVAIDEATKARLNELSMPLWHRNYFAKGAMPVFDTVEQFIGMGAPKLEKINLPRFDPELRQKVWHELDETGRFTLSSSLGRNIEINCNGCTKGQAIKALCRQLNISISQVMAFGDGDNDIEMLATVGIGVAMGNGTEKVKEAARFVTGRYDQDGIASFVEAMGF